MKSPLAWLYRVLTIVVVLELGACALPQSAEHDPLERINRGVFTFNRMLDHGVIRPLAYGYREVVPWPIRDRIGDFSSNLGTPLVLLHELLQGEFKRAGASFTRFWVNTIAGIGGLVDIASSVGLEKHSEDFGQTLAVWGVGDGPYLVLPVLGPSNLRDAAGAFGDLLFLNPATYYFNEQKLEWVPYALRGASILNTRVQLFEQIDDLERNSFDYYAALRSIYRQRRAIEIINDGPASATTPLSYPGKEVD